jgi:hypothetical protein
MIVKNLKKRVSASHVLIDAGFKEISSWYENNIFEKKRQILRFRP